MKDRQGLREHLAGAMNAVAEVTEQNVKAKHPEFHWELVERTAHELGDENSWRTTKEWSEHYLKV